MATTSCVPWVPRKSSSYPVYFVRSHLYTNPVSAKGYTKIFFVFGYFFCQGNHKIRKVVRGVKLLWSQIYHFQPLIFYIFLNFLFKFEPAVVTSDVDHDLRCKIYDVRVIKRLDLKSYILYLFSDLFPSPDYLFYKSVRIAHFIVIPSKYFYQVSINYLG